MESLRHKISDMLGRQLTTEEVETYIELHFATLEEACESFKRFCATYTDETH